MDSRDVIFLKRKSGWSTITKKVLFDWHEIPAKKRRTLRSPEEREESARKEKIGR